ncbi:MAG: hypothetical protein J2P19_32860 [Pseudonocardia sp.]|nr:hypothetical protein [Pseudonocardia sp.]
MSSTFAFVAAPIYWSCVSARLRTAEPSLFRRAVVREYMTAADHNTTAPAS